MNSSLSRAKKNDDLLLYDYQQNDTALYAMQKHKLR